MTKIYLAARYSRRDELRTYRDELTAAGYAVTSRWIDGNHEIGPEGSERASDRQREDYALEDFNDCWEANVVISFTEHPGAPGRQRGGRHVEFGIGLASGHRMIVVGPRENIFHRLPDVEVYDTWEKALEALER